MRWSGLLERDVVHQRLMTAQAGGRTARAMTQRPTRIGFCVETDHVPDARWLGAVMETIVILVPSRHELFHEVEELFDQAPKPRGRRRGRVGVFHGGFYAYHMPR